MWQMASSHIPHSSSALTREEVAAGFQIVDFVLLGLRYLHLGKACPLVEPKAENISFHSCSPWSKYWTFYDHCFFLSQKSIWKNNTAIYFKDKMLPNFKKFTNTCNKAFISLSRQAENQFRIGLHLFAVVLCQQVFVNEKNIA